MIRANRFARIALRIACATKFTIHTNLLPNFPKKNSIFRPFAVVPDALKHLDNEMHARKARAA